MNALLIDDEISAIITLRGMLQEFCPDIHVVGTAGSIPEALEAVRRLKPDLVFLDVEMPPGGTGFDFLRQAAPVDFGVIFTTAYAQYAIDAINKAQPLAYLTKPFSRGRLTEAVRTAREKLADRLAPEPDKQASPAGILVPNGRRGQEWVLFEEILYCEADGSTTDLVLWRRQKTEKIPLYRSLRDLESELPEWMFCRTHHGYLVNLGHVKSYRRTGRNGEATLANGVCVGISVQRMEAFVKKFEQFVRQWAGNR